METSPLLASLPQRYRERFMQFALGASVVQDIDELKIWADRFARPLLPFQTMIFATGRLNSGQITIDYLNGMGLPDGYLDSVLRKIPLSERLVIGRWLATREPQLVDDMTPRKDLSELEWQELETYHLKNIAAHGQIDVDGRRASYFSFSRIEPAPTSETKTLLRLIAPHLHQALINALAHQVSHRSSDAQPKLTSRQTRVLSEIMAGKTNQEIATCLKRSPHTVKHQVEQLLEKLGAANRAEAVARAIQFGIFPPF